MKGFLIKYRYKGAQPSSSYQYQRFFRALYGYTQVVTKSNGRTYVYYREGVLTTYPYIREGRNTVTVSENALEPLINFFKTGKNPAHEFEDLSNWTVTYYIEEVNVDESSALRAIYSALNRIMVPTETGLIRLRDLLQRTSFGTDELLAIREKGKNIVTSPWFKVVYEKDPLLLHLNDVFSHAAQTLL